MESWRWTALLLCCIGFFKELRPSEPFVTKYLMSVKGFSKETIVHVAYPIATYTYFCALPIIFLVTDFLRYRPIIVLEGAAFVTVFSMLIWTHGLTALKVIEVLYGLAGASEIAYHTYMYAKVDKVHYRRVTSWTYSSVFAGNFAAAVMSQCLVSFEVMNYHQLNYVSLCGVTMALVFAFFLPRVPKSLYFYRDEVDGEGNNNTNKDKGVGAAPPAIPASAPGRLAFSGRVRRAYSALWSDFKSAYNLNNPNVLKWSLWWAIATAGHLQITNYYQTLWEEIESGGKMYNGGVSAVQSALSAIFAFGVGHLRISWTKWGESFLCVISLIQGLDLIWFSQTTSLVTGYVLLIVYRTLYQILITIASAEVASGITEDSYGLIFGVNTFAAVCIQTLLTLIINEEGGLGLALDIRPQFLVYGCYYAVLGGAFFLSTMATTATFTRKTKGKTDKNENQNQDNDNDARDAETFTLSFRNGADSENAELAANSHEIVS